MKKQLLTLSVALGASLALSASTTIDILGTVYDVDTLAYMKCGPGTTVTQLKLTSGTKKLRVHYLTVDKRTPGVSMRAVCATDKVAGNEKTSTMATRKTTDQVLYFGGTNGDFYTTSGNASNGASKIGTPTTMCTVDGEVYKTANSQYQFSFDRDGVARVGRLSYYSGTATLGDNVALFRGVNCSSSVSSGITLYTPRWYGVTNQTDYEDAVTCTAKVVEGDEMISGESWRMEITSEPVAEGDVAIPSDGYVLFARGNNTNSNCNIGATDFLKSLHVGDIITMDQKILLNNERIYPRQVVSGNPKTNEAGEVLDSESERTDASALHPRTGIGVSASGDSIIMMVVDGRSAISDGVRTKALGTILQFAGAAEGVNLDGGGSSTLYTRAFGVMNVGSDGNERSVGNAIFATIEADWKDSEITEIQFADWTARLPRWGTYTPRILGFNQYGVMVTDSLTTYELSAPEALGTVVNDGVSIRITGDGLHALTATYNGLTASVPVYIDNDCTFATRLENVLLDNRRDYPIEIQANTGLHVVPVDAKILSWSSSDSEIATVDENGVVTGQNDGSCVITGVMGEESATLNVTIEIPKAPYSNLWMDNNLLWKFSGSGASGEMLLETGIDYGARIDYKITSTRSPQIALSPTEDYYLWSLPVGLNLRVQPCANSLKKVSVAIADNLDHRLTLTSDAIEAGSESTVVFNFSDYLDTDDVAIYPIKLTSLTFGLSGSNGDEDSILLPAFNVIYDDAALGVGSLGADDRNESSDGPTRYYNLQGQPMAAPTGLTIEVSGSTARKIIK
ncbi:MAG: phosphodiester glycosidase family protein [Bacteroidales bacterium]|nr:phosphodiester glycosidase family protein [Bacteroidales bacterium]